MSLFNVPKRTFQERRPSSVCILTVGASESQGSLLCRAGPSKSVPTEARQD